MGNLWDDGSVDGWPGPLAERGEGLLTQSATLELKGSRGGSRGVCWGLGLTGQVCWGTWMAAGQVTHRRDETREAVGGPGPKEAHLLHNGLSSAIGVAGAGGGCC